MMLPTTQQGVPVHRSKFFWLVIALPWMFSGAVTFGQQTVPSQAVPPAYSLQINTQRVVLDVVVTDRHEEPVANLTKDDFMIYEDKVPQTVLSLDNSTSVRPPQGMAISSTAELDRLEPDVPVNIIVLDEMNTRFEDEVFARYSVKRYLNTQGDLLTLPTMLLAVDLDHLMVLRDYTRSRAQIISALDHHLLTYPWHLQSGNFKSEQFNAAFASLMEVAQATGGHPGHKNMIWIGRGFPSMDPETLAPEAEKSLRTAIETCTNMLRDARVTLYTVDPAGISSESPPVDEDGFYEGDPFGGQVDFNMMAAATGGKAFFGRNNVDKLVESSARAGENFYTLSYKPTNEDQVSQTFRNIRVVMKDRNLHATTRLGYYAHTADIPPALGPDGRLSNRLIFDLRVAANSTMIYDGVPLTVARDPGDSNAFHLALKSSSIPWQQAAAGKLTAEVAVLVESFDRKGNKLTGNAYIESVSAPQTNQLLMPAQTTASLTVTVPTQPPAARLRFVIRADTNGKLGAQNFYLVDKKTLQDPSTGIPATRK